MNEYENIIGIYILIKRKQLHKLLLLFIFLIINSILRHCFKRKRFFSLKNKNNKFQREKKRKKKRKKTQRFSGNRKTRR
jgi:hypothetical protein